MPVANSSLSKKRHTRAPSSDIEEDSGPSQRKQQTQEEDVEMDEEEEQPRRSKKAKKEKKRGPKDDSDAEMDDEEEEELPLPDTRDHPLDKSQAPKIRAMASDWAMTREKVHNASYGFLREVAASVAEFTDGEKGEKVYFKPTFAACASIDGTWVRLSNRSTRSCVSCWIRSNT